MKKQEYIYNAKITEVYDGDTVTASIDLGFHVILQDQTIRLAEIDAPELKGRERLRGLAVRDWLRRRILNKEVVIETIRDKKETYGRWLGKIWIGDTCINDEMIELKLVDRYN